LFGPTMHRLSVHGQDARYLCLAFSLLEHPGVVLPANLDGQGLVF
jgi:hypothetical protein